MSISSISLILLGLSAQSIASVPENIHVNLHNQGGYMAGLFYKTPGATSYQQAHRWIAAGAYAQTPDVPKGTDFCVSAVVWPHAAYVNTYFNSEGPVSDLFTEVGNANLVFLGDLLFTEVHFVFNGTQTAGLTFEKVINTQKDPCPGYPH